MSSIRLFILDSLQREGEMHGHQLRQLAELEHLDMWTDISVGALYGAIKRLAAEELIEEARVEREGAYPERQVWRITEAGDKALHVLRRNGLREIVMKPDPVDLAIARFDVDDADGLPEVIGARLETLRAMRAETVSHTDRIRQYLSLTEQHVMRHKIARLDGEIVWHEQLLAHLPEFVADERARKDSRS